MAEQRFVVTDQVWRRLERHLPGKSSDAGVTARDNRLFPEAVFRRVRTGSPWRDLPPAFGNWNIRFRRFRRWARAGVFEDPFNAMSDNPDLEYALIDGTIVSVHQKATGAKGDSASCHWALARRPDDQDCRARGCAWQPCSLLTAAWAGTRYEGVDPRCSIRRASG